jgi:phage FluMu gp28-like protein
LPNGVQATRLSKHLGADSLSAAGGEGQGEVVCPSDSPIENQKSKIQNPSCPWNLYFRVSMPDAIKMGLVERINNATGSQFTREQFLEDCRSRARDEQIFEQAYLCAPAGEAANHIVEWSAIENCRRDYNIIRVHLEHAEIVERFGAFSPDREADRQYEIAEFINKAFLPLFQIKSNFRLGFDVAASGQGDLAVIYIDEVQGNALWLRGLFSCRTEDWDFLRTVLFHFLRLLKYVQAAGDESGLGRQICWEAARHFSSVFTPVNFASKKHDLGFTLMNQLATAQKHLPRNHQDIAADFFALRKVHQGARWIFTEGKNPNNASSHCDIAWAAALASEAHLIRRVAQVPFAQPYAVLSWWF